MNSFAFTCGDINGIGPEIVIRTLNRIYMNGDRFLFICPEEVFLKASSLTKPLFQYRILKSIPEKAEPGAVDILSFGRGRLTPGRAAKISGRLSYNAVEIGYKLADAGLIDGLITAPISKHAWELAGIHSPGHTELLAEWCRSDEFAMMFISGKMNCSLLTIHEPICRVSELLTVEGITRKLNLINQTLIIDLNINNPAIALLGLNPHAGEEGRIGSEEIRVMKPALDLLSQHMNIKGPYVADAFFANRLFRNFDMTVGAYHDQVLIPFKMLNFSSGVNYTAGLPVVRTSPDHGVAYDIAWKNCADESSTLEAFKLARKISKNRIKWNHRN